MPTYTWHTDPGHEWLSVPRSDIFKLNIQDKISIYSYQSKTRVYLDGDADASLFVSVFEALFGREEYLKRVRYSSNKQTRNSLSPVRRLDSYRNG